MTPEQALDINFLKQNCTRLYWFGLGFIQIKINDVYRVHIYTDKLPRTSNIEEIHNHRYHFVSRILKGTLEQTLYDVVKDEKGENILTQETCNPHTKKAFPEFRVTVNEMGRQTFAKGSEYYIDQMQFHRVYSKDAITLLCRSIVQRSEADVVYHEDLSPVCPFSVKVTEAELWKIVEEALND